MTSTSRDSRPCSRSVLVQSGSCVANSLTDSCRREHQDIRQQNRICVKDRPHFTAPFDGEKMDRPPQVVFTLRDFVEIRPDLNDLCHQLFRCCLAGRCWKKLREGGRAPADSSSKSMMRESRSRLQARDENLPRGRVHAQPRGETTPARWGVAPVAYLSRCGHGRQEPRRHRRRLRARRARGRRSIPARRSV